MPDITKSQSKKLWELSLEYLSQRADLKDVFDLASPKTNPQLTTINQIYFKLLESLTNKQGMPNSIGEIYNIKKVLKSFSPKKVIETYGQDWRLLFKTIKKDIRPSSRMKISIPNNYWVVFTKGALDGARFLSKFKSGNEFRSSIDFLAKNEALLTAAPLMLSHEIFGFGFALACDFLKESGWSQYSKPDVHIKDILKRTGFSDGTDLDTFKSVLTIAKNVNQTPYTVDKVLWLIGSGELYNVGIKFKTNRDEFIKYYNKRSSKPN